MFSKSAITLNGFVVECQPGYYGIGCLESCSVNCYSTRCNKVTGHCDSGCNSGWTGDKCDQRNIFCLMCFSCFSLVLNIQL